MTSTERRPQHIRRKRDIALGLSWLIPTVVAVFIGMIIEHCATAETRSWVFVGSLALIAIVLTWLFLVIRKWARVLDQAAGTLFHVRLLALWMNDWHDAALAGADEYLRLQSIEETVDMTPVEGVIDARTRVARAAARLEDRIAGDDPTTGFSLAPDALVPLAYGLGYRIKLPSGIRLMDFGTPPAQEPFDWVLASRSEQQRSFATVATTLVTDLEGRRGVHVHAALTGRPDYTPLPFPVAERIEVGLVPDGHLVEATVSSEPGSGRVHPAQATRVWNAAIRQALHFCGDGPVVLTARVPKTLGLAAGHLLAPAHRGAAAIRSNDPGCGNDGCANDACLRPWRHLVFLNHNQRTGAWEPVWLLEEQRDPRELLGLLEEA